MFEVEIDMMHIRDRACRSDGKLDEEQIRLTRTERSRNAKPEVELQQSIEMLQKDVTREEKNKK